MSLTVPVDEAIAQAVFERLELVPFVTAVRQTRQLDEWTPEDNQLLLSKQHPVRVPDLDHAGNPPAIAWDVELRIHIHVLASEHDQTPTDALLANLMAETVRTLTSPAHWHNWGDLAINSRFESTETVSSDGGFDAMVLPLVVTYRVSETNPYEVRA
jgi:hypothetical protein